STLLGDWRTLDSNLEGKKFGGVVCLGSSIPYHSSWTQAAGSQAGNSVATPLAAEEREAVLKRVVENFRAGLKEDGVLVLGLSRHNERSRAGVKLQFEGEIRGVRYQMHWEFTFDWKTKRRTWNSTIQGENGSQYAFEVDGHLFDHEELRDLCANYFTRVELRDIAADHYDRYLVCRA
ncbi:MAG: hypothetical protein ACREMQ_04195, partial [Longimicrobiales bacterium]